MQNVGKALAKHQLLHHQLRIIHKIDTVNLHEKNSRPCEFQRGFLTNMQKHIQDMHNTEQANLCPSCINIYLSLRIFKQHFEDVQSSPSLSSFQNPREYKINNYALSGTVEPFFLEPKESFDFPNSKVEVKPIVKEKIFENVNKLLRKVNSTAVL